VTIVRQIAIAAVAATVINILLRLLAVALLDIPQPEFEPLQLRDVIVSSLGATIAAGIVWALIVRFAKDPARTFRIVAAVALVLSLAAPLQVGLADPPDYPGTDAGSVGTLILMHLVTAAICVAVFTRPRGSGSPPR
jgi:purine-cytosine permease-like protein